MRFDPNSAEGRDLNSLLHPTTNLAVHEEKGPFMIERGKGIYLWDNHGKQYIDGLAGLWCMALGYGVEELAETAAEQMRKLAYSTLFFSRSHESAVQLAEKLKAMAPCDASKVFFGNSGSDANDTQIKLVWYYNNAIGRPKKKKIISRLRSYHGITIGSGSLSGLPHNHVDFDLPIANILHTDSPHYYHGAEPGETEEEFATRLADNLEKLIVREDPETVAAFIAEPVIGAGGVIVPPRTYFEKIQAVLEKYDLLLIDDEVICGFGRTGNLFGAQTFNMRPDTVSVAKSLSSAYVPLSAVIIPEFMYTPMVESSRRLGVFGHGYTYSGHPVCTAVTLKNLELMEERKVYDHAAQVSVRFQERLNSFAEHPLVGEVRGVGLLGGCELVKNKDSKTSFPPEHRVGFYCQERCQDRGLIVRDMANTLALAPALIITESEIDEIFDRFGKALNETLDWVRKEGLDKS